MSRKVKDGDVVWTWDYSDDGRSWAVGRFSLGQTIVERVGPKTSKVVCCLATGYKGRVANKRLFPTEAQARADAETAMRDVLDGLQSRVEALYRAVDGAS